MAGESAEDVARRRRDKAERLTRQAYLYERGAAGERLTAQALRDLPAGEWLVLHDLRWPGRRFANIDHIAIGPGGIFVIDSKNWSGDVAVRGQALRQNGRSREKAVAATADSAIAVSELLPGPWAKVVHPVICFAGETGPSGWARDVMLCTTSSVTGMLTTRKARLTPEQVSEGARLLDAGLESAVADALPTDAQSTTAPTRARRSRITPSPPQAPRSHARPRGRAPARSRLVAQGLRLIVLVVLMLTVFRYNEQIASAFVSLIEPE
jgi:hypothetical protein